MLILNDSENNHPVIIFKCLPKLKYSYLSWKNISFNYVMQLKQNIVQLTLNICSITII